MANKKETMVLKHREVIIQGALKLFAQKEYEKVTMDDVAKYVDYSKRTVYEYFKSKEDVYYAVVLSSFHQLLERVESVCAVIFNSVREQKGARKQTEGKSFSRISLKQYFFDLCLSLSDLYGENSLAFKVITQFSALPQDSPRLEILLEIYETGEKINAVLTEFLRLLMEVGAVKKDLPVIPTIFMLWSSLAGIIQMADAKSAYLEKSAGMNSQTFLLYSFELLYRSIAADIR